MPYTNHDDQIEYNHLWYMKNRDYQIEKMTQYYYNNKTKILLKQHKIKYKHSKNKKKEHK